jgi:predicted molibdopterin-dependent oxidoreductase YjgC
MPEANSFGAALLSSEEGSVMDVIKSIEKGSVKALMLVESDPFRSFPDDERLKQAIDKLDLFLVMDYLPSSAARLAHIFFPTQTLHEMETSFVNQEGRVQFATSVYRGGIPISQISAGGHPPRVFKRDIPGGEPEPAWQILVKLANAIPLPCREMLPLSRNDLWSWITKEYPIFDNVQIADELPKSIRVNPRQEKSRPFSSNQWSRSGQDSQRDSRLELLVVDWTFGTEELSAYSKFIQQVEKEPCLFISQTDASTLGLEDGQRIAVPLEKGRLEAILRIADNVAPGVMVMPRHRQLAWQKIEKWPVKVEIKQIRNGT